MKLIQRRSFSKIKNITPVHTTGVVYGLAVAVTQNRCFIFYPVLPSTMLTFSVNIYNVNIWLANITS